MRLSGVHVATITPFKEHQVDLDALGTHLDWLADAGVDGFVACGTTGEVPTLSVAEWIATVETTKKRADKHGLKTTAGCGGNATAKVLELLNQANELGCEAALVVTPYYNKPTKKGLIRHYHTLADQSDLPIVVYHVPSRTALPVDAETFGKLLEHPNIIGIKEATNDFTQWLAICEKIDRTQKCLLAGNDNIFAPILALGGSGIISASANVIPHEFVALYRLASQKQFREAFELQLKIDPLVRALFSETNPAPAKAALGLLRGLNEQLRGPLVNVEQSTRNTLREELTRLGKLS